MGTGQTLPETREAPFSRILAARFDGRRDRIIIVAAAMILVIALTDRSVGLDVSLGVLYTIPMIVLAMALSPAWLLAAALVCDLLRAAFDTPDTMLEAGLRFVLALAAYAGVGLLVASVRRNHQITVEHLERLRHEHRLRTGLEEQLEALVESSPAGILTLNDRGVVLAANNSAERMFGLDPAEDSLIGRSIEEHLPLLREALRVDTGGEPFRTAAQSQAKRRNGSLFLADMWFSTYAGKQGARLAAIVVDSSEEMREREERSLQQLSNGSRIMASALLHEVRNLCSAFSMVYARLKQRDGADGPDALQGLDHLARALTHVTSLELGRNEPELLEPVSLQHVLDDLQIIIEPGWRENGWRTHWDLPDPPPRVLANRQGLLQVFLNIAQNSYRAVQGMETAELWITASVDQKKAFVTVRDSGPGVSDPSLLFRPFQSGSSSTGLGLYISRALLRSYGGDLQYAGGHSGACFVAELPLLAAEPEW